METISSTKENFSMPLVDPPYQKNFEWEKFDYLFWRQWMGTRWWWSLGFGLGYILLIYVGQQRMRTRTAFNLKGILLWWNLGLAFFSLMGFLRTLPEMLSILSGSNGFHITVCSRDQMTIAHVYWEFLGTWSKVVELGDTAFIILRKQPLIFLHWYHHFSVLIYTWFSIDSNDPAHRWYISMNSGVHALMYSYYAFRCIGIKLSRFAIVLTTVQILQMVMGFGVNIYSIYAKRAGWDCPRPNINIWLAMGMYFSYLILFTGFFYKTYILKSRMRREGPTNKKLRKMD